MFVAGAEVAAGHVQTVRLGHAVDAALAVGDDDEGAQIGLIAFAAEHGVAVIALAGSHQIAATVAQIIEADAFHIVLQRLVLSDAGKHGHGRAAVRFGRQTPQADVFFADIELSRRVVGDAALDLAGEGEIAHANRADLAVTGVDQFPLALLAVGIIDEDIGLAAAGRAIHALAIGIALPRRLDAVGDIDQPPRLDIQAIDGDGLVGPVAGRDQNHRPPVQHEAFAQVDVVHLAVGQMLKNPTLHVVEVEPSLLVRADDQAVGRVRRIGPDGRIVGGVAGAADRSRFRHGDNGGKARCGDGARVLRRPGRQVQRPGQGRDRHQLVVGAFGCIFVGHQQGA
ncbi:hypothetical protein D3C86_1294440 [compost metagenome]